VDVGLAGAGGRKVAVIAYAPNADAIRVARESIAALGGHVLQEAKPGQAEEYRKEYRRLRRMNLATEQQISSFFKRVTGAYKSWVYAVNRERQLLTAMGVLTAHEGASCVTGEGWVRRRDIPSLEALARKIKGSGRLAFEVTKSEEAHPTCFDTPKVAEAFQGFTDVFGVPKYREINPALFLMFTFPFMFGAMFGDILHGFILGAIAALMIRRFERLNHRCGVLQVILEGRYVMLLCALTSVWFGLLYGDFGSLPVTLFSGRYGPGHAYPFGIDPVWHHAANKTVFINNLKMKLSLVLGFVHMSIGSAIAVLNALHFKDKITLVCTAIPQFIVFTLFLGYLVFLCVYKWLVTRNYPSLVNTLINMYTAPFNIPQQMYPGQLYVQLLILSIILICVPWMFFSKPVFLILRRRIPQEGMLDLWITSGIHVVEFGLSLISNTSSYLRLWAVSLAHVQLTAVLHQFTIGSSSWIVAVCLFPVYAACTILLLIGLEGLSACLHALRLNWIEFFSKFYAGGGTKFAPFSFGLDYEALYEQ
ncbi:V-type H+-transporting ATPase subunit a, partial [Pancytospora philotis]